MRLIDADELKKNIVLNTYTVSPKEMLVRALYGIDDAPTIDAVPVTRCEHCLFRDTEHPDWCHAHMTLIQPNDFCSYGRPRNAQQ